MRSMAAMKRRRKEEKLTMLLMDLIHFGGVCTHLRTLYLYTAAGVHAHPHRYYHHYHMPRILPHPIVQYVIYICSMSINTFFSIHVVFLSVCFIIYIYTY